ncbi:hypothetical protein KIW84_010928 [Lathyrus oleraceus]|uniref:Uncharacterized protein n=1 Tax=Pisum sativum TaxID=3888 RepID=A0A9D5BEE2_PEA|nr:hypothetical protein KIW84_010928 [Pisum sativum]
MPIMGMGMSIRRTCNSFKPQNSMLYGHAFNLGTLLHSLDHTPNNDYHGASRDTIVTRCQHSFMQLLSDTQFGELSARDLMLTSALKKDHLLTSPVHSKLLEAISSLISKP